MDQAATGPAIGRRLSGARSVAGAGWAGMRERLGAERQRWPLWLPVALGVGVGAYFDLPREPPVWPAPAVFLACLAAAVAARGRALAFSLCAGLAAAALGFAAAQLRTESLRAPVLAKRTAPLDVTGRIVDLQILPKGARLVLDRLAGPRFARLKGGTPVRIRVRVPGPAARLQVGRRVTVRAVLLPPPSAAAPGAFDFQRHAYFRRIGAVGYALGPARVAPGPAGGPSAWSLAVRRLRRHVAARVRDALPGPKGAVAAALLTGERAAIPPPVLAAIRDSGLAHLLAISGLHIGLVAGILFFLVRLGLAALPRVALRYPIKKWAAVAALAGAFFYLLLSGATVPTQRAYLMLAIVMLGVLLDRLALSMRLVAWAAVIVLSIAPESLLSPSFQMSFAAVVALVAAYEALRGRLSGWRSGLPPGEAPVRRAGLYLSGVGLTTVIAGTATAPFAVYHFGRLAVYGLAANLIAVPVTAFWIMPFGLLALILMPFGLEGPALSAMGWGVEGLIEIAKAVASWPGAARLVPALPAEGLLLIVAGGLWLTLWRRRWRACGIPLIIAGAASGLFARPPDILISGSGTLIAVRAADGRLLLSSARASRFSAGVWLKREGQAGRPLWPREGRSADGRITCDSLGCVYRAGGETVALVRDPGALPEDCRAATVVILTDWPGPPCPSARRVIHRVNLARDGSHAIWLPRDGLFGRRPLTIRHARRVRGTRPWVSPPPAWTRRYRLNAKGTALVRVRARPERRRRAGRRYQNRRRSPTRRP